VAILPCLLGDFWRVRFGADFPLVVRKARLMPFEISRN